MKELYALGKYEEIINMCNEKDELNIYELWYLGNSYYKLKKYDKVIETYKRYKSLNPEKDYLKNIYCWAIYQNYLKNPENISEKKFIEGTDYILNNNENDTLIYTKTVFNLCDYFKDKNTQYAYEYMYNYLKKIPHETLSSKGQIIKDKMGKERKTNSDKEKWYSLYTKTCLKIGKYEECIKYSEEAISNFSKENKMSDKAFWYKVRISKALRGLNKIEEAKELLLEVNLLKDYFFIKEEIADIYASQGEMDKAKKYLYEGILSKSSELDKKIKLIEKIGDILIEDNREKEGKLNYLLIQDIREKENWKKDNDISNKLEKLKDIIVDENNIKKQCEKIWREEYNKLVPEKEGVITKINNDKYGFIKYDEKTIFFQVKDVKAKDKTDILNKKVIFNIIESYDAKKNEKSYKAINIRLI
ncbi:MAG: hypothetical protein SOY42_09075 [Clostridium sp.]|nr:hypothetical protein [Clostridium sp.]MDY4078918.1 hypothetical protein [Clostridium sp.]